MLKNLTRSRVNGHHSEATNINCSHSKHFVYYLCYYMDLHLHIAHYSIALSLCSRCFAVSLPCPSYANIVDRCSARDFSFYIHRECECRSRAQHKLRSTVSIANARLTNLWNTIDEFGYGAAWIWPWIWIVWLVVQGIGLLPIKR